jgi:hypothetical protein
VIAGFLLECLIILSFPQKMNNSGFEEKLLSELRLMSDRIALLEQKVSPTHENFTCAEFGKLINRAPRWVADRVRIGRILSLTKNKPYSIPATELTRFRNTGI